MADDAIFMPVVINSRGFYLYRLSSRDARLRMLINEIRKAFYLQKREGERKREKFSRATLIGGQTSGKCL